MIPGSVSLMGVTREEEGGGGGGGGLAINYSKLFCRAELESPVHKMWFHVFLIKKKLNKL